MNSTITDHRVQTENPMCSESTENSRLRCAIFRPVRCQKVSSSGSQCSIHRPVIRLRRAVPVSGGPAVAVTRTYLRVRERFRFRTTVGTPNYPAVAACDARVNGRSHR